MKKALKYMKAILLSAIILVVISCNPETSKRSQSLNTYYQLSTNRVAAEWEPAKGVLFVCPPVIPKELIIEFAKDTHMYPIVDGDTGQKEAEKWFEEWGIDMTGVTFINLPIDYDIVVPRDWGPSAVFGNKGDFKLTDGYFVNSAPFSDLACNDSLVLHRYKSGEIYHSTNADKAIVSLADQLKFDVLDLPFTSTGGNVMTDGIGTAFSTCILLTENRFNGVSDQEFFHLNDSLLGFSTYHIISNFEKYGIQHIDCFLKLIDEETMLVSEPPEDHQLFSVYEHIVVNELSKLKTAYGRPYKIKRIKIVRFFEDYLTAYTNSLILNKVVYVPLYGIEQDVVALKTWESALPGYTIKGFEYYLDKQPFQATFPFGDYYEYGVNVGWASDDALHCRTRAIWDEEMIFISVKTVLPEIPIDQEAVVHATVIDYSDQELSINKVFINWRIKGRSEWNKLSMCTDDHSNHWFAVIPKHDPETIIEYYVEAKSNSGSIQRRPVSAPLGYYTFKYVTTIH